MTRLAISLLPTLGYFSLLLLAGCAIHLNQNALEHLCSNGLGSRRSCMSSEHLIPFGHHGPLGYLSSTQEELTRKSNHSSPQY